MRTLLATLLGAMVIPFIGVAVVSAPAHHGFRPPLRSSELEIRAVVLDAAPKLSPRLTPRVSRSFTRTDRSTPSRAGRTGTMQKEIVVGEMRSTIASWYANRPSQCWDRSGRHAVPKGIRIWTAHRTLACGTIVEIRGPNGLVRAPVYDQGPYVRGRDLDLSSDAFSIACGSTSRGVCRVMYAVAR